MQLSNYGNAAQVIGVQHTQQFQMQMNAKMFSILTDKLYQNKEGAVIRELSANARDAHVAAGKSELPFHITLPSWISTEFKIRDFGTGIDPDEFYDIYTNLGHSTKDHEDTSIGAYGLGSKTPFAITDSYTIRNYWNGIVYVYTAFKDSGMPTVSLIGSETSDEVNGLEISVDIGSDGNVSSFRRQCGEQLGYFDVKPIIHNYDDFEWPEIPELHMGYDVKAGHYSSEITIVMGGIPYTSPTRSLPEELKSVIYRLDVTLVAKLGEVDIPPSRESLELTAKTIAFISSKIIEISEDYVIDFAYRVEHADNDLQLNAILLSRIDEWLKTKDFNVSNYEYKKLKYSGETLTEIVSKELTMFNAKKNIKHYKSLRNNYNGCSVGTIVQMLRNYSNSSSNGDGNSLYLNDLSPRANKVINENKYSLSSNSVVIFPNERKSKMFSNAANEAYVKLKELGFEPIKLSTLMSMPVVLKNTTKSKSYNKPDQIFLTNHRHGDVIKTSIGELPEEGYFVTMSNWTMSQKDSYISCVHSVLDLDVYALRSHAQQAASRSGKWTSIHKLANKVIKGLTAKLKRAKDAEETLRVLSTHLNCGPLFDVYIEKVELNPKRKLAKLIKSCREAQVEFDNSRLTRQEEYQIVDLAIPEYKSEAKPPAYIVRYANETSDKWSHIINSTFYFNRWNDEGKAALSQALNLIEGNFK